MITVATDPRGVVTFHHGQEPDGLLPVFRARSMRTARRVADAVCRHAYDGRTLLVPGLPEAADQPAALDALLAFRDWLRGTKGISL